MGTEQIKYEDAAQIIQCEGWSCKHCKRFWGVDEHMARWCCATDLPCSGCGGRNLQKNYISCGACRTKKDADKWAELYAKAKWWEGLSWPLYSDTADKFFWDDDDLINEIDEQLELPEDITPEVRELLQKTPKEIITSLRLRLCSPNNGREFDMNDFLEDDLPEDETLEAAEINKTVNGWIAERAPLSWSGDGPPVSIESVIVFYEKNK